MKAKPPANDLERRLDTAINLLAILVASNLPSIRARAVVLHRAGLGRQQIATVCGTTPNVIGVRLAEEKRSAKKATNPNREIEDDSWKT